MPVLTATLSNNNPAASSLFFFLLVVSLLFSIGSCAANNNGNNNNHLNSPSVTVQSFWGPEQEGNDALDALLSSEESAVEKVDIYSTIGFASRPETNNNNSDDDEETQENFVKEFAYHPSTTRTEGKHKEGYSIFHLTDGYDNGDGGNDNGASELWGVLGRNGGFAGPLAHYSGKSAVRMTLMDREIEFGGNVCTFVGRVVQKKAKSGGGGDGDGKGKVNRRKNKKKKEPLLGLFNDIDFACPAYQLRGVELKLPDTVHVQLAGFAAQCLIFRNEKAFHDFQNRLKPTLPDNVREIQEQLLPNLVHQFIRSQMGMFPSPPYAGKPQFFQGQRWYDRKQSRMVQLCGIVQEAGVRTNNLTGKPFYWALLDCGGGLVLDVVLHPRMVNENRNPPRPGSVIYGFFSLSGKILP